MRFSKPKNATALAEIEPLEIEQWKDCPQHWDSPSVFQTPLWLETFCTAFDEFENRSVILHDRQGSAILLPLVENKKAPGLYTWLSLPYGCYGGPVLSKEQPVNLERAWELTWEFLKAQSFSAINITLSPEIQPPDWNNYRSRTLTTQTLKLENDFDSLVQNQFSASCRRAIRKAQRANIEVTQLEFEKHRDAFFHLYIQSLERWGAAEGFPEALFDRLWQLPGAAFWGAFHQDDLVSAALILTHENQQYYWLGAMDDRTQHLRPNNLLFHDILKQSISDGIRSFDFGNSDGLIGVFNFKKSFGPRLVSYSQMYEAGPLARGYRKLRALLRGEAEQT